MTVLQMRTTGLRTEAEAEVGDRIRASLAIIILPVEQMQCKLILVRKWLMEGSLARQTVRQRCPTTDQQLTGRTPTHSM